jgi:hypothetical protein
LKESASQTATQSDPRTHYSIYHIQPDSNVCQNPECVGKKHQDTHIPAIPRPEPVSTIPKSHHIAVAIGSAENKLKVAADNQTIVDNIPPMRRRIRYYVENNPSENTRVIEIPNSVDQTIESAERNVKTGTTKKPPSTPTQSTMKPLVSPIFEPLNDTNNHNKLLRELGGHQAAPSQSNIHVEGSLVKPTSRQRPRLCTAQGRNRYYDERQSHDGRGKQRNMQAKAEDCVPDLPLSDAN